MFFVGKPKKEPNQDKTEKEEKEKGQDRVENLIVEPHGLEIVNDIFHGHSIE